MLSIGHIATNGSSYYDQDDYYRSDGDHGEWHGKAAEALGLTGAVKPSDLENMISGQLPNGVQLGRVVDGEIQHRSGRDMTFTMPKWASIAAFVGRDERLVEAFKASVKEALTVFESEFVQTRVKENNQVSLETTGNGAWALYLHELSRNKDPNIHIHALWMNVTQRSDGEWRSVNNPSLYEHKMLLGEMQRLAFRQKVEELGYETRQTHSDGRFVAKGFEDAHIRAFSSRSQEIRSVAKELGTEDAKALATINLKTRPSKEVVEDREGLREQHHDRATIVGLNIDQIVQDARDRAQAQVDLSVPAGSPESAGNRPSSSAVHNSSGEASNTNPSFSGKSDQPADDTSQASVQEAKSSTGGSGWWTSMMNYLGQIFKPTRHADGPNQDPYLPRSPLSENALLARQAVSYGLRVLSERSAVFSEVDVLRQALRFEPAHGHAGIPEFRQSLRELIDEKLVLSSDEGLSTRESVELEKSVISTMIAGLGQGRVYAHPDKAGSALSDVRLGEDGRSLNQSQLDAAKLILSSSHRFIGIQGYAGTGKTTMLQGTKAVAEDKNVLLKEESIGVLAALQKMFGQREDGIRLYGLAPSHEAVRQLQNKAGIEAMTAQRFLHMNERIAEDRISAGQLAYEQKNWRNTILVMDENSMLGTGQMADFLKIASKLNIERVVLMGDRAQLASIDAGKPFAMLQDHGMPTAKLTEIHRQQDNSDVRAAVLRMVDGDVHGAFKALGDRIVEVKDRDQLAREAVRNLYAQGPGARDNAMMITSTNLMRRELNERIQAERISDGDVSQQGVSIRQLIPLHVTREESRFSFNYQEGNLVTFHRSIQGFEKGDTFKVSGRDEKTGTVRLMSQEGEERSFQPHKMDPKGKNSSVEISEERQVRLHAGDMVRWSATDNSSGPRMFTLGDTGQVEKTDNGSLSVRMTDGSLREMETGDMAARRLDLDYAGTINRFQGAEAPKPIGVLPTGEGAALNTSQAFYVLVSRAQQDALIFTDNKAELLRQVSEQSGEKSSAAESVLGVSYQIANLEAVAERTEDQSSVADKDDQSRSYYDEDGREIAGSDEAERADRDPEDDLEDALETTDLTIGEDDTGETVKDEEAEAAEEQEETQMEMEI